MVQIFTFCGNNQKIINEKLTTLQANNPKWKIKNINVNPIDFPGGWFVTVVYEE